MNLQVKSVDKADASQLLRWNKVLRDGYGFGRQMAWWRSDEATVAQFQNPISTRTSILLSAEVDGEAVGAVEAGFRSGEPAEIELAVANDVRRRGIGRTLLNAVRDELRGATDTMTAETYSDAGVAFAQAHGMKIGNRESRLILDLPLSPVRRSELEATSSGVDVRTWCGSCPDELVEDWAVLRARMDEDVPMGDLTRVLRTVDVEAVRQSERRMRDQGYVQVRTMAMMDGVGVGYTEILLSRADPEIVYQDDTFVDRSCRGRGIGRMMKTANVLQLASLPESEGSRALQTYTALTNAPMLALNTSFGFREVDILTILEGPLA